MTNVLVTGAGGFIGTHLVRYLKDCGFGKVRGVDIKLPKWGISAADQFELLDLRDPASARLAVKDMNIVFNLAADMGGAGFVFTGEHDGEIIRNNNYINLNMLDAARAEGVSKYLFTSSACVYPQELQEEVVSLKEEDAYPANPDSIYGWEKLNGEHLCLSYRKARWLNTYIVRLHNVYGPEGSWQDGREKAPAAMCRKVAVAKLTGQHSIEVWGDGEQVRSFMYVDDCVKGLYNIIFSRYIGPVNLGSTQAVTINHLVNIISDIAGYPVDITHIPGPLGVRFRNSDNTLCKALLGWEPNTRLEDGLVSTYEWIEEQCRKSLL